MPNVDNGNSDPPEGSTGELGSRYTVTCDLLFEAENGETVSGECEMNGRFAVEAPNSRSRCLRLDR